MSDTVEYLYFAKGEEHLAMARQSIASVRKVVPRADIFLVADDPKPENFGELAVQFVDMPKDMPLQLAKAEAQVRHILTGHYGRLTVFMDSDTLVLKDIEASVPQLSSADIFVTWRSAIHVPGDPTPVTENGVVALMPYNAGVWGLRCGREAKEAAIWLRERIRLRQFSGEINAWYADQIALAELCGIPPKEGVGVSRSPIPWLYHSHGVCINIAQLPCETWNYSPIEPGEDLSARGVLHFKGAHRKLMEGYASAIA